MRPRTFLATAAFALVVCACGTSGGPSGSATARASGAPPSAQPSAQPTATPIPWLDATLTPVPSPTPVVIPPDTAACAPGDLTGMAGWQGATGSMAGGVALTNVSQRACVLSGTPRLIALRSGTTILAPITYRPESGPGPGDTPDAAGPVLLQPGDQASAFLIWTNVCSVMRPVVTSVLVTLPTGGKPVVAGPDPLGSGFFGTPRCDQPTVGSTLSAYAFVPVPPPKPPSEPQAAAVTLSVPPTITAGGDLAFLVTLTNRGTQPASLTPCPTYTEDLIVDGRALKRPGIEQFVLNCAAIGAALAPGTTVILGMQYLVPSDVAPGPVELTWGLDPGGPFDANTSEAQASLVIVAP